MPDSGPRQPHEKRMAPIISSGPVRRPGSGRQFGLAAFVLVVVAGLLGGGYLWFSPREETVRVTGYTVGMVDRRTLQDTIELGGSVRARHQATVTAPEPGVIARLFVAEGDWVQQGERVAELDSESLRESLASLERSIERSIREYERFLLQHEYTTARHERQRRALETRVEDAMNDLLETERLAATGSVAAVEVRNARRSVDEAREALAGHEMDVTEAVALHRLSRENYEDDIAFTRREIAALERRLAATAITSPVSGRVVTISSAARTPGELLQQHQAILVLADTRDPVIETEIEEHYLSRIEVGRNVAVEIGGTRFLGSIERIGQLASVPADGGAPVVEIDVGIDLGGGEIVPGSSALVEILIGETEGALVLPRGPYLTSGNRRWIYRVDGDTATRVDVEYGLVTASFVEIRSGLSYQDMVITSSYAAFIDRGTVILGGNP